MKFYLFISVFVFTSLQAASPKKAREGTTRKKANISEQARDRVSGNSSSEASNRARNREARQERLNLSHEQRHTVEQYLETNVRKKITSPEFLDTTEVSHTQRSRMGSGEVEASIELERQYNWGEKDAFFKYETHVTNLPNGNLAFGKKSEVNKGEGDYDARIEFIGGVDPLKIKDPKRDGIKKPQIQKIKIDLGDGFIEHKAKVTFRSDDYRARFVPPYPRKQGIEFQIMTGPKSNPVENTVFVELWKSYHSKEKPIKVVTVTVYKNEDFVRESQLEIRLPEGKQRPCGPAGCGGRRSWRW